ncbi:MAG: DNA primase [Patescibacteria group bacterium]
MPGNSTVEEIKNRLDIVEFIRSYVPLLSAGKNFKAPCPFHKEKTPSFMVSPERQTWHCFGACSEGGDIFKFLMKYENLEFYEALKILAEKAGVELKRISPADQKQFGILYEINESAKDFFKTELERFPAVLKYLLGRGLKKETIDEFEIGFAPNSFDILTVKLVNVGYDVKDIERAGLNFKSERGSYVDRFRNRIVFPIHNHFGKIVGFSARIFGEGAGSEQQLAKYINSPETPIFNKSKILYGFHKSKNDIREEKTAVLVEGQMDFLSVYQDGMKNVIAVSGTALTEDHLRVLKKYADRLILCFDSDEAGFRAAERAVDLAAQNDLNVKILTMKEFKDPAEAVLKSPGRMKKLAEEAKEAMEFYFERYLKNNFQFPVSGSIDLTEFKKNLRIVLEKIKNMASAVERFHWLKELSDLVGIKEGVLTEEMERLGSGIKPSRIIDKNAINRQVVQFPTARIELIAQRLIGLLSFKNEFFSKTENYIDYFPKDYSVILKNLRGESELNDEKAAELLNSISLRFSLEFHNLDEEKLTAEFEELLNQLRLEYLKEKRETLINLIKEAERQNNETKAISALKEFHEVSRLMML